MKKLICISMCVFLFGCQSDGGAKPASGLGNLVVTVKAEAKKGWRDPRNEEAYSSASAGTGKAFETVDYALLDDIVVWVQSASLPVTVAEVENFKLDVAQPKKELLTGALGQWVISNSGASPQSIYVRGESGRAYNIGMLAAGDRVTFVPQEIGLNELISDAGDRSIARIYIVPSKTDSRVTTSGTKLSFSGLQPGEVTIHSWHPRLPGSTVKVNIEPGQTAKATITVGVNSLPKAP